MKLPAGNSRPFGSATRTKLPVWVNWVLRLTEPFMLALISRSTKPGPPGATSPCSTRTNCTSALVTPSALTMNCTVSPGRTLRLST